ncbi:MAG: ATP12 family protein [Alphaproteobacteria bacterium]
MPKKPAEIESQLALLAQRAASDRAAMLAEVLGYAETDLLCYRAEVPALHERQKTVFDPILNALHDAFGIECRVTRHVVPVEQRWRRSKSSPGFLPEPPTASWPRFTR